MTQMVDEYSSDNLERAYRVFHRYCDNNIITELALKVNPRDFASDLHDVSMRHLLSLRMLYSL